MKIITICGSFKFKEEMLEIALELGSLGNCVLTPIFPLNSNKKQLSEEQIVTLGKMHKEKIKLADAILVVDIDGYIGNATNSEIEFASSLGKEIIYFSQIDDLKNIK